MLKKRYLFLIIVCFFAISAVNAQEIANDTDITANDYDSSLMTESVDENLLSMSLIEEEIQGSADNGTFTALQEKINNASEGSIINLENNYTYDDSFSKDGIIINKSLTINGNGYTFDGKNNARIFSIDADVTLKNINFINGNANENVGGVIYTRWGVNTNVIIINSSFVNNSASYEGGVIYTSWGVNLIVNDCSFVNNSAPFGSAIYTGEGVYIICANSSFVNNSGSAISGNAKNITNCCFVNNSGGAVRGIAENITNCCFVNNSAKSYGGAIKGSAENIINCCFVNNSADKGGAVYSDCFYMNNCTFINNSAKSDGGAIYTEYADSSIFSNLSFINNTAIRGGAIFSQPSVSSIYTIINSNFINNYADNGSSIFISDDTFGGVDAKILDSYFYTNENKELIYYINSIGFLFLQNNTMVSPNSYKIYINVKPDIISSKKYLILDNETCCINKPFIIAFTDDNGNKIRLDKDIPITFTDLKNDKLSFEINAIFDSDSGFYYISCNQSGLYNLSVDTKFSNNLTVVPIILEVYSLKPDLSINVNNRSYSENTTFVVNVTSEDYPVNKGNISFYIDGKKVGFADVSNGLATFNYTYPHVGTFSILAIYEDNDYLSANMTASFTVNKMPTVLSAESVIFDEKDDKIFTVELKDNNSNGVSGQNVKIEVIKYSGESRTFNGITGANGIAEYDVKNLEGGMWFVAGTYDGNGNYINSKFSDKFIIIRMDTTTNIEGIDNPQVNHTYKLKANIHDENGKLVKEGIVQFYLDGVDIGSIDLSKNQGHQSGLLGACEPIFDYKLGDDDSDLYIEYTPSKAGKYTLSAVYEGTTIYKSSNETTTFIVSEDTSLNLSAPEVVKYYKGPERFVVTLTDGNNNPLPNKTISITISNRTYTRTTDNNGIASMAIGLLSGAYDVIVKCDDISVSSKVTVLSTIDGNDVVKIYGNDTQYYATFLDTEGNYLAKNTQVQFNLNGIIYSQEIMDNKGTAKLDINEQPGTYIITAINPQNGENVANTITVLSNIVENNDLVKYYNESDKFSVRVLSPSGKYASGEKVKFTIKDNIYESTSNSNGYAFLDAVLEPGNYIVTTSYGGNNVSNVINILPTLNDKDMQVSSSDIYVGENEVIKVVLPSDATGKVSTTINNKEYSSNVNNGVGNIIVSGLNYGNYDIDITYSGDSHYNSLKSKTSFMVYKTVDLSAPDVTKYYGGSERFVVTLKDLEGKAIKNATVKITINGRTSNRTTDDNGIASMGINLNSGKYNVTSEYNGTKVNSTVTVKDTVSSNDFTKIFRNGTQYYGTFVDSQGNLIKNTDVKININGVFYTKKTNDQGVARMNINLPPGTYILTAENPASGEQHTTKITVLPSIVENHDLTKYYKNASKYTLRIIGDDGKPVGEGVTVKLNINGVFYERKTNATGYMSMNINLPPGKYTVTAEYNGLRASNTIKVLPILETKDLKMSYKDGSKFEAKVLDGQGKPYASQTVTFNINGVFYQRTTGDDGVARLSINLMAGEYIITSSYNGLNAANKVTISG